MDRLGVAGGTRVGRRLDLVGLGVGAGGDDAALQEPRIVVTGDSDFLANGLITWTANRDLAVRMIAWLAGVEAARVVAVSDRQNRRIQLTERRRAWMYAVNLGVLPLLPLVVYGVRSRTQPRRRS